MASLLVPPRRRGEEILDREDVDPEVVTRSLGDVAKANALFGGVSAALAELEDAIPALAESASLLDVATGIGDIPLAAMKKLGEKGIRLTTFGLDSAEELARTSRANVTEAVCADALRLPFATRSVDVVLCSQFLHHLLPGDAVTLIREMDRVARVRVIISDLRRSWVAAGGLWIASFPLRFHPISRHDGVVSVMRGFTRSELNEIVGRALGIEIHATRRRGFRITAGWTPVGV
jgi:2-polyprenyl-3-methyl-5-hydroxy-6-metoxy-1,4-benzoquinol methylase